MKYIVNKKAILILLVVILCFYDFSKFNNSSLYNTNFEMNFKIISPDTGTIILNFINKYSHIFIQQDTIFALNKNKIFRGKIPYPYLARIVFKNEKVSYQSDPFFIEPGKQQIIVEINNNLGLTYTLIGSKTQHEYITKYASFFKNIHKKRDNWYSEIPIIAKTENWNNIDVKDSMLNLLKGIISEDDSLTTKYIKKNPASYVGLWMLINKFNKRSYKSIYQTGFNYLDHDLKITFTGQKLNEALENASLLAIGNILPIMKFIDINGNNYKISYNKYNYTIIDFWYSRCGPCIGDFRTIKTFYDSLKEKQIQLIAISTDKSSDIDYWKQKIRSENYPWLQLLDENGKWSESHSINAFPYNIVVDSTGKICYKDLSPGMIRSIFLLNK